MDIIVMDIIVSLVFLDAFAFTRLNALGGRPGLLRQRRKTLGHASRRTK